MNKYNVKNDCLDKAKHFSIIAKDSLGLFSKSEEKDKIINLIDSLSSEKKIVDWNKICKKIFMIRSKIIIKDNYVKVKILEFFSKNYFLISFIFTIFLIFI